MSVLLRGADVIDGTGRPPLCPAALIINGTRLEWVGPVDAVRGLERFERIYDLEGRTIIPGLIDAHTHISFNGRESVLKLIRDSRDKLLLEAARTVARVLWCGITSIRDVGGFEYIDVAIKKAVDTGLIPGPRMQVAGKLICQTGGHAHFIGREADGVAELTRAAREQLKAGADLIKVMATGGGATPGQNVEASQLSVEEMRAAVEVAHREGKRVASHCHGRAGIVNSILAGVDSIEHGSLLDEEAVAMMRERGTFLVATLGYGNESAMASDPEWGERVTRLRERARQNLALAKSAGVPVVAGSDAGGNPFAPHEFSIQVQMEQLVVHGLTPMEALQAATATAARLMKLDGVIGTLEPGKEADLLVLGANPLVDIRAARQIELIFQGGAVVNRERLLAGIEPAR